MKIIEMGNNRRRRYRCARCGCLFLAKDSETRGPSRNEREVGVERVCVCPCCGGRVRRYAEEVRG